MSRTDDGYESLAPAQERAASEVKPGHGADIDDCDPVLGCGSPGTVTEYLDGSARCWACERSWPGLEPPMAGLHTADDFEPADAVEAYEDMRRAS